MNTVTPIAIRAIARSSHSQNATASDSGPALLADSVHDVPVAVVVGDDDNALLLQSSMPRPADVESLRPDGASDDLDRFGLTATELVWRATFDRLRARGFALRERYSPEWIPSWRKLGHDDAWLDEHDFLWPDFEDCVAVEHATTLDAVRLADNTPVALQLKPPTAESLPILRLLSSPELASDPRNHACPLLDLTPLDEKSTNALVAVYPLARDWRMPPMALVAEAIVFIDQILEGFAFLHEHNIAHRDIAARNIMMDPRPLFANGTNSLRNLTRVPLAEPAATHSRLFPAPGTAVAYWIIDFGLSTYFPSRDARTPVVWEGGPCDFPECWETPVGAEKAKPTRAYDAFKADVHTLGGFLARYFLPSIPRLAPLVSAMTASDPDARPELTDCVRAFRAIARELSVWDLARGVGNAARLDWRPWSGVDAMTAGARDWARYVNAASAFLIWRPEVRVGGERIA